MFSERIRTTCPRDCYDSCGMVADRTTGKLRILGDPDHHLARGALCQKCAIAYNSVWLDPAARIRTPLRRAGRKGEGKFEVVSWEEALADISSRFRPLVDRGEAHRIVNTHYTGTFSLIAFWFPWRFFNRLGCTEVDPDTVCNKAGHVALNYLTGDSMMGFDPRQIANAAVLCVWGANPSHSAPHLHEHWFRGSAAKKIVIDPIRHATADAADLFLQLRPGSDAALAFALMHVVAREGLLDVDFLATHTIGWEEIEPTLATCTPEWGEIHTGVPAALIEEAARLFAAGPSMMWIGQGMQRQPRGGNAVRAVATLVAATGNLGRPGTGMCYINGPQTRGLDLNYFMAPHLGAQAAISHMDLAAHLEDPEKSTALFSWNNNILASSPAQSRLRAALGREDLFHVAIDLFSTDTTDFADYLLPAASFLEFDDLVVPYFFSSLSAQVKVKEPEGDALPNQEIFRRLALAMGFTEPELFESDASLLEAGIAQAGLDLTFVELAAVGTAEPNREPYVAFGDGRFATPSGKMELASAQAAADGHPRIPEPHFDAPPSGDSLRILSPAAAERMNSEYDNAAAIHRRSGADDIRLHSGEARSRDLAAGSLVELWNDSGCLNLRVAIDDAVPPGVGLVHKGRWPKLSPNRANVNVLFAGQKSDLGESTAVHGVEARLRKVLEKN